MTDEQRFFFDLRGWILLPAVLSRQEIDAAKAECYAAVESGEHLGARGYEGELQNSSITRPSSTSCTTSCPTIRS